MSEVAALLSLRTSCASDGLSQKSGLAASDSSSETRRFRPATSKMPPELAQLGGEPLQESADALEVGFVDRHGSIYFWWRRSGISPPSTAAAVSGTG